MASSIHTVFAEKLVDKNSFALSVWTYFRRIERSGGGCGGKLYIGVVAALFAGATFVRRLHFLFCACGQKLNPSLLVVDADERVRTTRWHWIAGNRSKKGIIQTNWETREN